jgi:signal transduction histidine kinase
MTGAAAILIVDDDPHQHRLLEVLLEPAGYLTIGAASGEEALAVIAKHRPDLILLDILMPGIDGYELTRTLKANPVTANIPIIMVTASTDRESRLAGLDAGAEDFLNKPFDRTELWLRVRNLLRLKAFAEQLQGVNQELEMFSYSVSHDLRAPLRHIQGFVKLLRKDAGPTLSAESLVHLTTISRSAEQMGDLIDDLLSFSRVGRAELQKSLVDLDQLVRETLGDFQVELKERSCVWKIEPLPAVQADRALLRMVLVNLISNAVKFTGARADAEIQIGCVPSENGETVIFIRDNGAGFDPQHADKLFGVFQRLHGEDEFPGTGIGLANVQRIIDRHGGRTWAEGVVNGGATFYFSIPTP